MGSGMPELGSKISLISKADIRYEGRLFTVDPQECTIALANVRSFGTEDRETQFPVAPQNQVYEYILFRGSDIKDIRVVNAVTSIPNDPAIVQMTVPQAMGGQQSFQQQPGYGHPVMGQMGAMPGGMPGQYGQSYGIMNPVGPVMGMPPQQNRQGMAKQTSEQSVLDIITGGSRSTTPNPLLARKSPTIDQGTQVGHQQPMGKGSDKQNNRNNQGVHRDRESVLSGGRPHSGLSNHNEGKGMKDMHQQGGAHGQGHPGGRGRAGAWAPITRGGNGMRGRGARGRGHFRISHSAVSTLKAKNTLKFDNDYDFEQANTEFEELRSQLAKTKIDGGLESEKKDDSGNETGAGDGEVEEESEVIHYDKSKSFFDNISCEAVERSKGKSQRTDWRTERKLNSETFGVASMRRGGFRGRGGFYNRGAANMGNYRNANNANNPAYRGAYRGRGNNRKNNAQVGNGAQNAQPNQRIAKEPQNNPSQQQQPTKRLVTSTA